MPTSALNVTFQHFLADLRPDGDGVTNGELLARFVKSRDEAALATLIQRHAAMVWGVCSRLLHGRHDAEDAFQATFLVLVRKASAVPREAVANWLYGVARQTAIRVRATAIKRGQREKQMVTMPEPAMPKVRDVELQTLVDEELSRLPGHYRGVVILCDLEGMTRKEAARHLNIPEGSVASRLARARAMLAKRLSQRGITFTGSVAMMLSSGVASSAPTALVASTIQAATLLATGQAAGVISVKVATLTEGVMKAMLLSKIKTLLPVVLILGVLATGGVLLTDRTAAGQDDRKPNAEKPGEPAAVPVRKFAAPVPIRDKVKQEPIAWGKEINGLQAGLGYEADERRVYHPGETVKLVVRVRNVGKEAVTFQYLRHFFIENPPTVTNSQGKAIAFKDGAVKGIYKVLDATVEPGKEIELHQLQITLGDNPTDTPQDSTLSGLDTYQLQYERILGNSLLTSVSIKTDPSLLKLATGKLELVVKPKTAWGKEVDGVQAGLSIPNLHEIEIGGKVSAVVQLRNVGKKAATVSVWPLWDQGARVLDSEGQQVRSTRAPAPLFEIVPEEITLQPGQTIDVGKSSIYVLEANAKDKPVPPGVVDQFSIYVQPGKYQAEFASFVRNHPNLSTGRVEFEVSTPVNQLPAPKETPTDKDRLQGNWQILSLDLGGTVIKREDRPDQWKETFGREMFFKGDRYGAVEYSNFKFKLDETRDPKQITLYSDDGKLTFRGIYSLEGDNLKLCMNGDGESILRPEEFVTKKGAQVIITTLKRVPPKK